MRRLIRRLLDPKSTGPRTNGVPAPTQIVDRATQDLRVIARRYRELERNSKDSDSRATFGEIAAEYEARADGQSANVAP